MRKIVLFIAIAIFISGCSTNRLVYSTTEYIRYRDYNQNVPVGRVFRNSISEEEIVNGLKYEMGHYLFMIDGISRDRDTMVENASIDEFKTMLENIGMKCDDEICNFIGGEVTRFDNRHCKFLLYFCRTRVTYTRPEFFEVIIPYKYKFDKIKIIPRKDIDEETKDMKFW